MKPIASKEAYSHLHTLSHEERMIGLELSRCQSGAKGYWHWIENHCVIETEDAQVRTIKAAGGLRKAQRMAFSLSWHQRHIWECPERTLILKSRQIGMSTGESIKLYGDAKFNGRSGAVIAHDLTSAQYLFEKFERCWKNDALEQPKLRTGNIRQMRFAHPQQGRVEVCTAQSPDSLRSRTLQNIHGSEVPYWGEEGPKLHKAIMKFVGQRLGTSVGYEGTAQGEDPLFHPMWINAEQYCKLKFTADEQGPFGFRVERVIVDHDKWNKFHPLFISVLVDEKASMELEEGEENHILKTLTEEEEWLLADQGASFEFLKWRRSTIVHACNGDINDFHQEFCVTSEQAFIATGQPRFNYDPLNRMHIEPGTAGFLQRSTKYSGELKFVEDAKGDLILFRPPEPGHRYVMGIDSAEGIPSENPNCPHCSGDADEASMGVFDIDTPKLEQVALYAGPFTEDELVEPAIALAEHFNMAYIVTEKTAGHGEHLCTELDKKYPTARLYKGKKGTGLEVHTGNRIRLVNDVASVLNEEMFDLHSERTIHQLKMVKKYHLKRSGRERSESAPGHHDDDMSQLWCVVRGWRFYPRGLDPIEHHQHLVRRRAGRIAQIVEQDNVNPDPGGFY